MIQVATVPPLIFGAGSAGRLAELLPPGLRNARVVIISDPALVRLGFADRVATGLHCDQVEIFSDIAGEPKYDEVQRAAECVQRVGAEVVVGLGGGSALDTAKIAAAIAPGSCDPLEYALAATDLPKRTAFTVMVPTTAGTGSEVTSTNVFSGREGEKLWVWGAQTRGDLVVMDPDLTESLPPQIAAWCGMDAFVHAFEATTNRNSHKGIASYANGAMHTTRRALPRAIADAGDTDARETLLLASCHAGLAIDACGTSIAHNLSHALAGCAPVNHGLATLLAFEVALPWLVQQPTPQIEGVATAQGLSSAAKLPGYVTGLIDKCQIERRLPPSFSQITVERLLAEADRSANAPMRKATARTVTEKDMETFAEKLLALA